MLKMYKILSLMVFLILITSSKSSYIFLNGSFSNPIWVRTPYIWDSPVKPSSFNVTSYLIPLGTDVKGMQNCSGPNPNLAPLMKGAIVMVVPDGGCSVNKHALVAQNAGASAVLVLTTTTFMFASLSQINPEPNVLKIPVVFIEVRDFTKVIAPTLARQEMVIIKIEGDKNSLEILNKGGIIFHTVSLIIINLVGLSLMVYKLIEFIRSRTYSVAIGAFICIIIACINNILYVPDPWGFWHRMTSFTYEIIVLNFIDCFQTISIILVTFHLSYVLFKSTNYHKYVIISYIFAAFLIIGYAAAIIVDVSYQLTYSFGEITPNSLQWFRISVFLLFIAFYLTCDIIFVKRLVSLFKLTSQRKEKKESQYKRLIGTTSCIWLIICLSIVLRGLVLHPPNIENPIPLLSIQAVNALLAPFLAICYFCLFKVHLLQRKSNNSSDNKLSNDSKRFVKLDNENIN